MHFSFGGDAAGRPERPARAGAAPGAGAAAGDAAGGAAGGATGGGENWEAPREVLVKSGGEGWVVGRRSNGRELYVVSDSRARSGPARRPPGLPTRLTPCPWSH
jgi:hypothetical protein